MSAFTTSLASELSRDFTFTALVPWFQIQTQTLTLTPTKPDPKLFADREMKLFSSLGESWSRDQLKAVFRL